MARVVDERGEPSSVVPIERGEAGVRGLGARDVSRDERDPRAEPWPWSGLSSSVAPNVEVTRKA